MSEPTTSQRAIEWLEQQLTDLTGIRNATPRDPSFKNWRQATLTVMQRIWPADQTRSERFRRIPFSPADPRADARTVREWYSRGCQEAARVLKGFIDEIHAHGVPEVSGEAVPEAKPSDFDDGIPTVDLPAGDLGASTSAADMAENMLAELADTPPQGSDPASPEPPRLQIEVPAPPPVTPAPPAVAGPPPVRPSAAVPARAPAPAADVRAAKKPRNMKTRLRDLLGFAQLSAKALAGIPHEAPEDQAAPPRPASGTSPGAPVGPPSLEMQPLGDEVVPPTRSAPPTLGKPAASGPTWPTPHAQAPPQPPPVPRVASVAPLAPVVPVLPVAQAAPVVPVPPVAPAPHPVAPALPTPPDPASAVPAEDALREPGSSVTMSRPTTLRASIEKVSIDSLISPEFRSPGSERPPKSTQPETPSAEPAAPTPRSEPDLLTSATEDFLRTSPVLGATGRRVRRDIEEPEFDDADAIAVATMAHELARMGVPEDRQPETRARLLDLARRFERAELDWSAMRKAVWFAMEYPELARRLMPVLLPWMDRAA